MDEKKQVKNLPEETELQIENANIDPPDIRQDFRPPSTPTDKV